MHFQPRLWLNKHNIVVIWKHSNRGDGMVPALEVVLQAWQKVECAQPLWPKVPSIQIGMWKLADCVADDPISWDVVSQLFTIYRSQLGYRSWDQTKNLICTQAGQAYYDLFRVVCTCCWLHLHSRHWCLLMSFTFILDWRWCSACSIWRVVSFTFIPEWCWCSACKIWRVACGHDVFHFKETWMHSLWFYPNWTFSVD